LGLFSSGGDLLSECSLLTEADWNSMDEEQVANELCKKIFELSKSRQRWAKMINIGITVPGPVDASSSKVRDIPSMKNLQEVNLSLLLQNHLSSKQLFGGDREFEVNVENDANAFARQLISSPRSVLANDFVAIYVGYGIGGAFVVDGKIRRGHTSQAGEIGHMMIVLSGAGCECGNRGCLETVASGASILRQARSLDLLSENGVQWNYLRIIEEALDGPLAKDLTPLFADFGKFLGIGIANILNCWNPGKVIIGGPVAKAEKLFRGGMDQEIASRSYANMEVDIEIIDPNKISDLDLALNLAMHGGK